MGIVLAFALATGACRDARGPETVSLRMTGSPNEATVTIDDIFVGRLDFVRARGVALPPGKHRITVESPGFFPHDAEVEAKLGQGPIVLETRLTPIPD